jgi:hypothetical protein
MDRSNDAIIGVGINYSWAEFKNYAVSLDRCGFQGRRILFVHNITGPARNALANLGFELVEYTPKKVVVVDRFKAIHDWLGREQENLRYVILSDIRDVVFQTDPSEWFEAHAGEAKIYGTSEFIFFRNESCNPFWVEQLYGRKTLDTLLAKEEVICAGTICGEVDAVKRLALRIYQSSTDRHGDDQAALNVLLRTEFKDEMKIPTPEDGFVITVGWYLIGTTNESLHQGDKAVGERSNLRTNPPELRNGVVYPAGSKTPYCVVHQYERGTRWEPEIDKQYVADFVVQEASPRKHPDGTRHDGWVRKKTKAKYSKDGCTVDWFDIYERR